MQTSYTIKRTTTNDKDFRDLVKNLDDELWNELKEDQATYDQYNKVSNIKTAVVVYDGRNPVACGCFKAFDKNTVEIKRMFVKKSHREQGLSKIVLSELENWAKENGFAYAVLETSVRFSTARKLYETSGYQHIPNYGQYANLAESVCMKKTLSSA